MDSRLRGNDGTLPAERTAGSSNDLVVPAALVGMAVVGTVVGSLLPGLAGDGATRGKAQLVGAVTGVVMVAVGTLVFYVLLNG